METNWLLSRTWVRQPCLGSVIASSHISTDAVADRQSHPLALNGPTTHETTRARFASAVGIVLLHSPQPFKPNCITNATTLPTSPQRLTARTPL